MFKNDGIFDGNIIKEIFSFGVRVYGGNFFFGIESIGFFGIMFKRFYSDLLEILWLVMLQFIKVKVYMDRLLFIVSELVDMKEVIVD